MDLDRDLTRRRLLAMLGIGVGGAATLGPWHRLVASTPPDDGIEVPVGSTEPGLTARPEAPTVDDLARSFGWDTEAMFRYVADEVDSLPYAGALRGAEGTLWSKGGNSVDKALLLGALLTAAGADWRFAVGELDPAARELVLTRPPRPLADVKRRVGADLLAPDAFAEWNGEDPWHRETDVGAWYELAAARAAATYSMLAEALTTAGIEPAPPTPAPPGPHVWVQVADGSAWIDLDPTLPGAAVGDALAAATTTATDLPAELFHTVTVRLVAEIVTGGVPTMTTLIEHTIRAAEAAGVPIYVVHAPPTVIDVGGAIVGQQRYRPVILIGDETVLADVFVVLERGEGIAGAFGEEASAEGQALAEWLEVDIHVPGKDVRTERRVVFDRVAARREGGDLGLDDVPPIDVTHVDDEIGDVYLPCASPLPIAITAGRVHWASLELPPGFNGGDVVARAGIATAFIRELCYLDRLDDLGAMPFADEPVVTALRQVSSGSAGDPVRVGVDLLHVHETTVGAAEGWGLRVGAVRHAAERMALHADAGLDGPEVVEVGVGRVFELAADQGIDVRVLAPGDGPAELAGLPASTLERIDAALAGGRYVVIPAQPVNLAGDPRIGWWEYDPADGATIDRLDDGGHVTLVEYAIILITVWTANAVVWTEIMLRANRASMQELRDLAAEAQSP